MKKLILLSILLPLFSFSQCPPVPNNLLTTDTIRYFLNLDSKCGSEHLIKYFKHKKSTNSYDEIFSTLMNEKDLVYLSESKKTIYQLIKSYAQNFEVTRKNERIYYYQLAQLAYLSGASEEAFFYVNQASNNEDNDSLSVLLQSFKTELLMENLQFDEANKSYVKLGNLIGTAPFELNTFYRIGAKLALHTENWNSAQNNLAAWKKNISLPEEKMQFYFTSSRFYDAKREFRKALNQIDSAVYYSEQLNYKNYLQNDLLLQKASVLRKLSNYPAALRLLYRLESKSKLSNEDFQKKLYTESIYAYNEIGNILEVERYFKQLSKISDSIARIKFKSQIEIQEKQRALDSLNLSKHDLELKSAELEVSISQRNTMLILTATGLILLLMIVLIIRNRNKLKTVQLQAAYNEKELALKDSNIELLNKELELKQKSTVIDNIQQKIDEVLSDPKSTSILELNQLVKSKNKELTSKNVDYEVILKNTNSKFHQAFTQIHSQLNQSEIQLVTLIRLRTSNSEISKYFEISKDSLAKKKYRLKKKLNIDKDLSLEDYITSFKED